MLDRAAASVVDGPYYFINQTPVNFLIDKHGNLRKKAVGSATSITTANVRDTI